MTTTPNQTNYCKDCRFFAGKDNKDENALCSNPMLLSIVTGQPKTHCSIERGSKASSVYPCGAEGRLFEPKTPAAANPDETRIA